MACVVLTGTVFFKTGNETFTMTAPPGPALMLWNSLSGAKGPLPQKKQLDFTPQQATPAAGH